MLLFFLVVLVNINSVDPDRDRTMQLPDILKRISTVPCYRNLTRADI